MLVSAFACNFLDAMNRGDAEEESWALIIKEEEWHRVSNVSATTYPCLLCVHLAHLKDPEANIILCYAAASLVLLAQEGFWMQETLHGVCRGVVRCGLGRRGVPGLLNESEHRALWSIA